jgi:hypothetical protein
MIEALVVGIAVDVGQHLAVDRGIAEAHDDLRLQVLLAFVVCVEWVTYVLGNAIVVRFREQPSNGGSLLRLWGKKKKILRKSGDRT